MNYKLFKNISLLFISLTNLELYNQSHYFPNGPRTSQNPHKPQKPSTNSQSTVQMRLNCERPNEQRSISEITSTVF